MDFALGSGFLVLLLDQVHTPNAVMGVVFVVASFSYCLRFLLFSFTKNYLLILPMQLLHMIGYALFWSAVVEYNKEVVSRYVATAVSDIVISLYYSFANIISNIVCGVLFQYVGGRLILKMMAAANGIWVLVLVLFNMKYSNCLKKTDHQEKEYIAIA